MNNSKKIIISFLISIWCVYVTPSIVSADLACGAGSVCSGSGTYTKVNACVLSNNQTSCIPSNIQNNVGYSCSTGGGAGSCVGSTPGRLGCGTPQTSNGSVTTCNCSLTGDACFVDGAVCTDSSDPYAGHGSCECFTTGSNIKYCEPPEQTSTQTCCGAGSVCGDGIVDPGETCSNCPADIGVCGPVCGNGINESGENCSTCPQDSSGCGGGGSTPPPGTTSVPTQTPAPTPIICNTSIRQMGTSVRFYLETGTQLPTQYNTSMSDSFLDKLPSDPTVATADVVMVRPNATLQQGDAYDFYISNADGTPNTNGRYISSYMVTSLNRTGNQAGNNIDSVVIWDSAAYSASPSTYTGIPATHIASYQLGTGQSFANANLSGAIGTQNRFPNTSFVGDPKSRITIGFPCPSITPSPTPTLTPTPTPAIIQGRVLQDDGIAGLSGGVCISPFTPVPYSPPGGVITVTYNGNEYTASVNPDGTWQISVPSSITGEHTVSLSTSNPTDVCGCPSGCQYTGVDSPSNNIVFYYQTNDIRDPWWQVIGGSIFAAEDSGTAIQSTIPTDSCIGGECTPYLSLQNDAAEAESSGVAFTGGGEIDTSNTQGYQSGNVDQDGRNIVSRDAGVDTLIENYAYFYRLYSMGLNPSEDLNAIQAKPSLAPANGRAYFRNGDMTINDQWSLSSSESMVIFIDGDLTINNRINVAEGGFLSFIVSGSITVTHSVCQNNGSVDARIEGVFIADGVFSVNSTGSGDCKFVGEGIFTAWTGFDLRRDYKDGAEGDFLNAKEPTEVFRYRPDFVVNIPTRMTRPIYEWQEVAP